jgi:hypothetical protein
VAVPTPEQGLLGIFEWYFRAQDDWREECKTVKDGTEGESKLGESICLLQVIGNRWRWGTVRKAAVHKESLWTTAEERGGAITRGQEPATHGNKVNLLTYGVTRKRLRCCLDVRHRVNNNYVECIVMRFAELQINSYVPIVTRTLKWAAVGVKVLSLKLH